MCIFTMEWMNRRKNEMDRGRIFFFRNMKHSENVFKLQCLAARNIIHRHTRNGYKEMEDVVRRKNSLHKQSI